MNPEILQRILSCQRLPTLPQVAARVLALTGDTNVSMAELAETIQSDQALAARVLRTVNSSMFGLRQKCSSISQAIVLLGLDTVRMVALGFIIVGAIHNPPGAGLDVRAHWRRSLTAAVAARLAARLAGLSNPEECFLGGLLQDIGMLAMHEALGEDYVRIIAPAAGVHRAIARLELASLQIHHADVGAMLAARWKLPDSLVMPIKYHERPTAAPQTQLAAARAVGLGSLAADILTGEDAAEPLKRFYKLASQWFGMTRAQADSVLETTVAQTKVASDLMHLDAAELPNSLALLEVARGRIVETEVLSAVDAQRIDLPAENCDSVDELTGAASRVGFDRAAIAAFEQTLADAGPLSLAMVRINRTAELEREHGTDVRDTVLISAAGRLLASLAGTRAMVARFLPDHFAILFPRTERFTACRLIGAAVESLTREPVRLIAARTTTPGDVRIMADTSVVTVDTSQAERLGDVGEVIALAMGNLGGDVSAHGAVAA